MTDLPGCSAGAGDTQAAEDGTVFGVKHDDEADARLTADLAAITEAERQALRPAVPSVPVPDLDTIRQRLPKFECAIRSMANRAGYVIDPMADLDHAAVRATRADIDALIAALVAVEAERDTLRAIAEEAVEEFADALLYAGDYFREKWGYDETLARLRRALSVVPGEREREAR